MHGSGGVGGASLPEREEEAFMDAAKLAKLSSVKVKAAKSRRGVGTGKWRNEKGSEGGRRGGAHIRYEAPSCSFSFPLFSLR